MYPIRVLCKVMESVSVASTTIRDVSGGGILTKKSWSWYCARKRSTSAQAASTVVAAWPVSCKLTGSMWGAIAHEA